MNRWWRSRSSLSCHEQGDKLKRVYLLPLYVVYFFFLLIVAYKLGETSVKKQEIYDRGVKDGQRVQLAQDEDLYNKCKYYVDLWR